MGQGIHPPLPVRVPRELRLALKRAAGGRGLTVSEYVRRTLVGATAADGAWPLAEPADPSPDDREGVPA